MGLELFLVPGTQVVSRQGVTPIHSTYKYSCKLCCFHRRISSPCVPYISVAPYLHESSDWPPRTPPNLSRFAAFTSSRDFPTNNNYGVMISDDSRPLTGFSPLSAVYWQLIYIYIYTHTYAVSLSLYIYIYIHTHTHTHTHTRSLYIYIHTHTHVYISVCVYIFTHICSLSLSLHIYIYIYIHTHTLMYSLCL